MACLQITYLYPYDIMYSKVWFFLTKSALKFQNIHCRRFYIGKYYIVIIISRFIFGEYLQNFHVKNVHASFQTLFLEQLLSFHNNTKTKIPQFTFLTQKKNRETHT